MLAAQLQRLARMATTGEADEARRQAAFGDRVRGSVRSSLVLDAQAIRAVLAHVEQLERERDAARAQLADLLEAARIASASDDGWLQRLLQRWVA